ncbi:TPA: ribbon-helix-helix protein, CopG family [Candidatus Bathyarchaeota archaeon]|nr:ribbon-helix-helix protein, CopG family [Candidatus Bathyarchaeota archaeon]
MKISVSLPEKIAKAIDQIVERADSPARNRSSLIALALRDFLVRNYPEIYLRPRKAVKPTVLAYLKAMPEERFRMRSPRLHGRRIRTEWVEIG